MVTIGHCRTIASDFGSMTSSREEKVFDGFQPVLMKPPWRHQLLVVDLVCGGQCERLPQPPGVSPTVRDATFRGHTLVGLRVVSVCRYHPEATNISCYDIRRLFRTGIQVTQISGESFDVFHDTNRFSISECKFQGILYHLRCSIGRRVPSTPW